MDLPGEAYLFNLSLLAITIAVVSALVMLVRQQLTQCCPDDAAIANRRWRGNQPRQSFPSRSCRRPRLSGGRRVLTFRELAWPASSKSSTGREALTFDDVLLAPAHSAVLPAEADIAPG